MVNQEKIGKFIAALRKEKKMTQEQLAQKLGVSNRSVSRWENGNTMPDLSMLPVLAEELGVSVTELLNGERTEQIASSQEVVENVIELSAHEKRVKAKKVNGCFFTGLLCVCLVIFHGQFGILDFIEDVRVREFLLGLFTGLGIAFEIAGFLCNSRERKLTEKEVAVLSNPEEFVKMTTAEEMLQFAKKSQKADLKQYKKAFEAIEEKLLPEETAYFSMVADAFVVNEQWEDAWKPWHIALAVTKERLLVCGESIHGRFMTFYDVEVFEKKDICAVELTNRKIAVKMSEQILHIEGEKMEAIKEKLEAALKK